jgi:hypothetical protein
MWDRYERNTGHAITSVQTRVKHPVLSFMAATLDGMVTGLSDGDAVWLATFMTGSNETPVAIVSTQISGQRMLVRPV